MTNNKTDPPRLFAFNIVDHPAGGSQLGLIAKRTYEVHNGACLVSPAQVPLVDSPQMSEDGLTLLNDVDVALNRTQVDVIARGVARSPVARRTFEVRVRVATLDRQLRVFGNRRCYRDTGGRLRFSEPEEIHEVPIRWEGAYGGLDAVALAKHGDPYESYCRSNGDRYEPKLGMHAYPRNRVGKGYVIEPTKDALEACELPNFEDPEHPLTPETLAIGRPDAWPAGPPVAALGFLSYAAFPRSAMLGLLPPFQIDRFAPDAFFEVRAGVLDAQCVADQVALTRRMHIGVAQQSAFGMRMQDVSPGDRVELLGLHPRHESWLFELPRERPEMTIRMPDGGPISLSAKIRTLLFEPESSRVCLTWVGEHREATPVGPGKREKIRFGIVWRARA